MFRAGNNGSLLAHAQGLRHVKQDEIVATPGHLLIYMRTHHLICSGCAHYSPRLCLVSMKFAGHECFSKCILKSPARTGSKSWLPGVGLADPALCSAVSESFNHRATRACVWAPDVKTRSIQMRSEMDNEVYTDITHDRQVTMVTLPWRPYTGRL